MWNLFFVIVPCSHGLFLLFFRLRFFIINKCQIKFSLNNFISNNSFFLWNSMTNDSTESGIQVSTLRAQFFSFHIQQRAKLTTWLTFNGWLRDDTKEWRHNDAVALPSSSSVNWVKERPRGNLIYRSASA